jgi:hypothetical protein
MKNIQEIIKINRNSIAHKINVDNNQIKESMLLLRDLLKSKYAKSFYYRDSEFTCFIELDKNSNVINVRADHSHFFGNDYVTIFGVTLKVNNGVVEVKKENMVKDIPVYFGSSADNKLMQLRNELDNINDKIEIELRKILDNDESYAEALNKERLSLTTNLKFKEDFDQALEQSDIIKKCSQKLNDFYNHKPLAITSGEIKVRYDKIETNIYMKVEPYVYDSCLTLSFTRDTVYLGNLEISYAGKIKFEPYFKNQKYFTKEISSLKFMRNIFKKYLTKCLGEII